MEFSHIPVLLQPCLDGLNIDPAGIYLDGTAGGAGHSREIAKRLTTGRLIALDQDPDAVAVATERLKGLPAQVVQVNFREAARVLAELGIPADTDLRAVADSTNITAGCCKKLTHDEIYEILLECK